MNMIHERPRSLARLAQAVERSPVTAILGPRQVGKTTLARVFAKGREASFYDLEAEPDRARLANPFTALSPLIGLVVLDEIQAMPSLFRVLRVLADRPDSAVRFLILGSASPSLLRETSESLAGRVEFVELPGFEVAELTPADWPRLWVRGGFPRSLFAASEENSAAWRANFLATLFSRDLPGLGVGLSSKALRRFFTMLAHFHGQTWNASKIGRSMGLSDKTVRAWLDLLTGCFLVRQLPPWHANVAKRQVKAPKVYLRDTGLLHALLVLSDRESLLSHPHAGASFEGFAIEQVLAAVRPPEAYFWATHAGAELDLLFAHCGRFIGVEAKFDEAPRTTKSMAVALADLQLAHLFVVHPGPHRFPLSERITAWPVAEVGSLPARLDEIVRA